MFVSVLQRSNQELARYENAYQLPDAVFDQLIKPCAEDLCVKYAGDFEMSDTMKGIVVLGGAAATIGQLEYRKHRGRRLDGILATRPVEHENGQVVYEHAPPPAARAPTPPPPTRGRTPGIFQGGPGTPVK